MKLLAHTDLTVPSVIDLYVTRPDDVKTIRHASHRKPQVMWFHAKWCRFCVNMTAAWESASRDKRADWHPIDCSKSRNIAEQMNVSSFPTILKYHKGGLSEYSGDRSVESIIRFASP